MIQYPEIQPQSTSNSKDVYVKSIIGTRSDTVFTFNQNGTVDRSTPAGVNLVRCIMPADATILMVSYTARTASDAATTATISLGVLLPFLTIVSVTTTATVTTAMPHGLTTADTIVVNGAETANHNQAAPVAVASVPTTTTFTYTITSQAGTSVQGRIGVTSYFVKTADVKTAATAIGQQWPSVTRLGANANANGFTSGMLAASGWPFPSNFPGPAGAATNAGSGLPIGTNLVLFPFYVETGGASTTGGPWTFNVIYTR